MLSIPTIKINQYNLLISRDFYFVFLSNMFIKVQQFGERFSLSSLLWKTRESNKDLVLVKLRKVIQVYKVNI